MKKYSRVFIPTQGKNCPEFRNLDGKKGDSESLRISFSNGTFVAAEGVNALDIHFGQCCGNPAIEYQDKITTKQPSFGTISGNTW